uniref:Uncharacterized protein n=1 Tax=Cryptococcus bacillisporus CA1280 TaxID=1296109 RepID=A0A0D0UP90_CRYGA|nr:hypothetical protein I312_01062 [Cryptococcus bacillisporus CA1280]
MPLSRSMWNDDRALIVELLAVSTRLRRLQVIVHRLPGRSDSRWKPVLRTSLHKRKDNSNVRRRTIAASFRHAAHSQSLFSSCHQCLSYFSHIQPFSLWASVTVM